jgi:hypothetical protein
MSKYDINDPRRHNHRRVLEAIKSKRSPYDLMTADMLAEQLHFDLTTAYRILARLRDEKLIHIASWIPTLETETKKAPKPRYKAGEGKNAKRPAADPLINAARYREKMRARIRVKDCVRAHGEFNPFAQLMWAAA